MDRRDFLIRAGRAALAASAAPLLRTAAAADPTPGDLSLFLAGDVMTGRGIDQILPRSVDPVLHEPYVRDARRYVELAEEANGPIPRDVPPDHVWGDALEELDRAAPDARIVNLETSVTTHDEPWPGKGIHYRMHPANVDVLTAAGIDVAVLGNNHVLDWGRPGLEETLATLRGAGLGTAGAGLDEAEARAPAIIDGPGGRLLVFSVASRDAGVPPDWEAGPDRSGVAYLPGPTVERAEALAERIAAVRRPGDRVVVSIHWGGNWGYEVPDAQRAFAHALVEAGAADVVHGHSSHHPKALEVHEGRPILYGAGDLLNDYEGIGGHESFRPDLTLGYLPTLDASGALVAFEMTPLRVRRFRLERASEEEADWLARRMDREGRRFGSRVERSGDRLVLRW